MPVGKFIAVIFIIFSTLLTQGCWSYTELEDRAVVSALGVDKGREGRLLVTAQIIVPSQIAGGQGGTTSSGSEMKSPVLVVSAEARTMSEAVTLLEKKSGRKLFFSFMEIIVIGEELARENIVPVTDWVNRSRELRLRTLLAVANGTAREVIESPGAALEKIPGFFLASSVKASFETNSRIVLSDFYRFLSSVQAKCREPVAMRIITLKTSGEKQAQITGSAVFKGYRLVGWLTEIETRGYLWIIKRIERSSISVPFPGKGYIAFKIRGPSANIETDFIDGSPVVNIKIKLKANIDEVHDVNLNLDKPENIDKLEPLLEDHVVWELKTALEKARELNADIFGFGEAFHRQHPGKWKELSKNWDGIFPEIPVYAQVKATIRRTENISNPIRPS